MMIFRIFENTYLKDFQELRAFEVFLARLKKTVYLLLRKRALPPKKSIAARGERRIAAR